MVKTIQNPEELDSSTVSGKHIYKYDKTKKIKKKKKHKKHKKSKYAKSSSNSSSSPDEIAGKNKVKKI